MKAKELNQNAFVPLIRVLLTVGGIVVILSSLYQIVSSLPEIRYWLLLLVAALVSWPKLKLPVKAAEPLFYLVLLLYGAPAGILLSVVATICATRFIFHRNKLIIGVQLGQSALSAAAAALIGVSLQAWLQEPGSLVTDPSISLLNVLAWMAWVRFLFHADWALVADTIRQHKIRERFTQGSWLNSFVAYFGAAFTSGVVLLVAREQRPHIALLSLLVLTIFFFAYQHFKDQYIEKYLLVHNSAEEMSELHLRTIEALSTAIDAKDEGAHLSARRIQIYTEGVGRALGLNSTELKALRVASLLRDIGKLAVPDHILHKTRELTAAELEKLKMHPVIGANILARVGFPYPIVPAVKHHHEHWDGTGYPDRLRGNEIPLTARILAVVDAFDDTCGAHPSAALREAAINLLIQESGHKYDPNVVQTFLDHLPALQAEVAQLELPMESVQQISGLTSAGDPDLTQTQYVDEIRRARQEGSELLELARVLSSTLNLEEAVSIIISRLSRLTTFDTYVMYVFEENRDAAYVAGAIGKYADELRSHQVNVGQGVIGQSLATDQRVYSGNPAQEFAALTPKIQQAFQSMTVVPLSKMGRMIGSLVFLSQQPDGYTVENQRVVEMVAPLAADALFNTVAYRRTETSAVTDALTGLPNSRMLQIAFEEERHRADRYNVKLAMLMIDLDRFKQVNDTFGHLAGDQVLREVAYCLKHELRASDKLIRYAGDEFVALLPHAEESSLNDLIARIQRFLESRCYKINGVDVSLGASIGYAIYGRDGHNLQELMRVADEGMYRNKSFRKNQIKPRRNASSPAAYSESETSAVSVPEAVAS